MNNFEKMSEGIAETGKFCSRNEVAKNINKLAEEGDFLSKLWSIFGEPSEIHEGGYTYGLRYKPEELTFNAYVYTSGPSYSWSVPEIGPEKLKSILRELEEQLGEADPSECSVSYDSDYGKVITGYKDGAPFIDVTDSEDSE